MNIMIYDSHFYRVLNMENDLHHRADLHQPIKLFSLLRFTFL